MRIGVTGGAGFIGRRTCEWIRELGHEAIPIDRAHGRDVLAPDLTQSLADDELDVIVHLAGVLGTAELYDRLDEAIDVNVRGTAHVLQACDRLGMAYVGITMPDVWANVYQATKAAARRLAEAFLEIGVPVSHVRAWNVYGEGQAHGPGHPQKLVPTFSRAAWTGIPLPIWGSGSQTVDLVYVGDVARVLAEVAVLTAQADPDYPRLYDAGTGEPVAVLQVAERILEITGSAAGVEHLPMRAGEQELDAPLACPGRGWAELGWVPEVWDGDAFERTVRSYAFTFGDKVRSISTPRRIGQAEREIVIDERTGLQAGYHVKHWDGRQDGIATPNDVVRIKVEGGAKA